MTFPLTRPVVFPLFGVSTDGACACGVEGCKRVGKHAACLWRDVEYGSAVERPEPGAGCAIRTGAHPKGSDVFVVDLDGPDAAKLFDSMGPCPETYSVESPRAEGGWHLYFNHPGFHVKTSSGALGPHIDIRGDGGIVVAPGSPHANGGTYWVCDDVPIADAPEWLLTWLKAQRAPTEAQSYPGDVTDPDELEHRRGLYAAYLRTEAPARGPSFRGQGDTILFEVVQRGAYDLALPVEDVLELVEEHYDPRCDPMWGPELEERVHHKAHDAKTNSSRPQAIPLPSDCFGALSITDGHETFLDTKHVTPTGLGIVWGGWDQPISQPVYLLDGLIPEHKVVTFFAAGGSVKSWCAFNLAISVATGHPWLGKGVKPGKALILDYEDGRYEFQRRMKILRGGLLEDLPNLGYKYCAPQITKLELWKELSDMGLTLLVIDTLGSAMPGDADENTTAFAEAVKIAGRFTECGCTVVIVAHANKSGGLRGSSAIWDSSDVAFRFEPVSETDDIKRMRMVCDKPGPQKRPAPVNVELSDAGLKTFVDEAGDTARNVVGPEGLKAAVLLALADGPLVSEALYARVRAPGRGERAVDATIKELRALGQVVSLGKFKGWQLDDEAKRRARLLASAVTADSSADLARDAHVPSEDVRAAIAAGGITLRTGREGGGFIVTPQGLRSGGLY